MDRNVLYIDWISPVNHNGFNRAFFYSLQDRDQDVVFYDERMVVELQNVRYFTTGDRMSRFLSVCRLLKKTESDIVFFLTYDSLFIPILLMFGKTLVCYEHNTTPEGKSIKHVIWQRLFFRKIMRLTQTPQQFNILEKYGSNCRFVGSPLERMYSKPYECSEAERNIVIVPSQRVSESELQKLEFLFSNYEVMILRSVVAQLPMNSRVRTWQMTLVDRIPFHEIAPEVRCVVIAIDSRVRPSGWFNEAISHGIPIVITSSLMANIFETTFPGYPVITPDDTNDLRLNISNIKYVDDYYSENYIEQSNCRFRRRVLEVLDK